MAILSRNDIKGFFVRILLVISLLPLDSHSASLDQVKMAFIFNLSRYVSWPESVFETENTPFTICLNANHKFITLLELTVKGEKVNNRAYDVVSLSDVEKLADCQILFVSAENYSKGFKISENLLSKVLYISDAEGFARKSGMIEIKQQEQRLKLLVNLKLVKNSDLQFRSNLLNLMTIIE